MLIVEKRGRVEVVDGIPSYLVVGEHGGGGRRAVVHLGCSDGGDGEGAGEDVGSSGRRTVHTVVARVGTGDIETGRRDELARGRGLVVEGGHAAHVVNIVETEDAGEGVGCNGGRGVTVVGLAGCGDAADDIERIDGAEVLGDEGI